MTRRLTWVKAGTQDAWYLRDELLKESNLSGHIGSLNHHMGIGKPRDVPEWYFWTYGGKVLGPFMTLEAAKIAIQLTY